LTEIFENHSKKPIRAIEGLRGISIIAIIGFHGGWPCFGGGGRGVDLFYVISGFLITFHLLGEKDLYGRVNLRKFYWRRALRTFPAFYTFLFGYWLICEVVFLDFKPILFDSLLIAAAHLTNIMIGWFDKNVLVAHTWALSLEWQLYLFFGAILFLVTRRQMTIVVGALVLLIPLWRTVLFLMIGETGPCHRYAYSFDTRIDTILWGCLIGLMVSRKNGSDFLRKLFSSQLLFCLGCGLVLISAYLSSQSSIFMSTIGYSITSIGCGFVLLFGIFGGDNLITKFLQLKPMQTLGRLSYSLYLWHPVALGLAGRAANRFPVSLHEAANVGAYVFFSLMFSTGSYLFIERPFLHLKGQQSIVED
jgi:peptidoglycan/LPS O-acetylase OafA/YrhL